MYYICVIFIFGLQRRILGALRVKGYRNNLFNRNRPASGRSCIVILILIDQRYIYPQRLIIFHFLWNLCAKCMYLDAIYVFLLFALSILATL